MNNKRYVCDTISQDFLMISNKILPILGPDASCILSLLISKYKYWEGQGQLDADYSFHKNSEEMERELGLTKKPRQAAMNLLVSMGLVKTFRKSCPFPLAVSTSVGCDCGNN